ncbi:MAG: TonB-dependent receptor [Methanobacteriota archaeon]|nr:MAG: TonB-dependent receptor [Euryarchaeota archaeon]
MSLRRKNSTFFSRIRSEITFFNYHIKDEIVPFEILGEVFYRNSAETNRRGLELGGDISLYKGFRFNLAYTLSDFVYDTYNARVIELDSTGNFITIDRNFSGNFVPSIPKHNLNIALSYEKQLSPQTSLFGKLSYWYTSGMYVNDQNSEKTDGYRLLNAVGGLNFRIAPFDILFSLGVDNILDKTYVAFTNTNSVNGRFYEAGSPRNFYGSIKLGYLF